MSTTDPRALDAIRDVLLRRQGLLFVEPPVARRASDNLLRAFDVHLADLGYAVSQRLRDRVAGLDDTAIEALRARTEDVLARPFAAKETHTPLFWRFPDDVPVDTWSLWLTRVLVHFCQAEGQPCVHCRATATTHVLSPCFHVVCDRCFDGANYTACPVCNRNTDASPFYLPKEALALSPKERVRFKLLDAGDNLDAAARELFERFCARPQALSPSDRDDLTALVRGLGARCIPWIPEKVPVRENRAVILGTLFRALPAAVVLPVARVMLTTATDVLRFLAVYSGRDASLQALPHAVSNLNPDDRRWAETTRVALTAQAKAYEDYARRYKSTYPMVLQRAIQTECFPLVKISRPVRRALLEVLEGLDDDARVEDMLRHRALWVHVGEALHPHDYKHRFPGVARAFDVVRGRLPDGTPAPVVRTFNARVAQAIAAGDHAAFLSTLRERPGELARRFDHALRLAGSDALAVARTAAALTQSAGRLSTPVLLTLYSLLPTRTKPVPVRLYWPKGRLSLGTQAADTRPALPADAITPAVRAAEAELLRRFATRGPVGDAVIDGALSRVVVPFNERTAGRSAVALTRGSRLAVADSKAIRLFLHWCQPPRGSTTDVDLSVGFYDDAWKYRGVCSFYQLTLTAPDGAVVARSSGDRTSAPHPDGASEFIDVDRDAARAAGFRYAAMIVNAYSGLPFSELERATAGVMLRDDLGGAHFDPRTVELAFDLQGDNGVYLPLVVDLASDTIHWMDVYAPGAIAMNTVASSNRDVARLGPALIAYFGSGQRASMFDLGLLHAAARAARVTVRDDDGTLRRFVRAEGEDPTRFLARLRGGAPDATPTTLGPLRAPALGVLLRGDVALPDGSAAYALFRERITAPLAASDLLASG